MYRSYFKEKYLDQPTNKVLKKTLWTYLFQTFLFRKWCQYSNWIELNWQESSCKMQVFAVVWMRSSLQHLCKVACVCKMFHFSYTTWYYAIQLWSDYARLSRFIWWQMNLNFGWFFMSSYLIIFDFWRFYGMINIVNLYKILIN